MQLSIKDLAAQLCQSIAEHVPPQFAWVPTAALAAVLLLGLVLMLRGARLAPVFAATLFLVGGGVAGSSVARWVALPEVPVMALAGLLSGLIGFLFFRLWMTGLVAATFVAIGLGVYGFQALAPHLPQYTADQFDSQNQLVTLPTANAAAAQRTPLQEVQSVWAFLDGRVPRLQFNVGVITAATAVAGLLFGIFLPLASRALWAATTGVLLLLIGLTALLDLYWPTALNWLATLGPWGWGVVGGFWLFALVYNLITCRPPKKPNVTVDEPAKPARPGGATRPATV